MFIKKYNLQFTDKIIPILSAYTHLTDLKLYKVGNDSKHCYEITLNLLQTIIYAHWS